MPLWHLCLWLPLLHAAAEIDLEVPGADDECAPGAEDGSCALSAVQLRGRRATNGSDACDAHPAARAMRAVAPACAAACPQLCSVAVPVLAAAAEDAGAAKSAFCASAALIACALEANAEICRPALQEAADLLEGVTVPRTTADFDALCEGVDTATAAASVELALLQRAKAGGGAAAALDRALSGKEADKRCQRASEGQTCVSSNSWIYCSNHKRLSGPVQCEQRSGHMSLCRHDGIGLSHDYCDDPFCRNGGAYAGDGLYCHSGNVMSCHGGEPPRLVESCADQYWTDMNGVRYTRNNQCVGQHPHPYCSLSW